MESLLFNGEGINISDLHLILYGAGVVYMAITVSLFIYTIWFSDYFEGNTRLENVVLVICLFFWPITFTIFSFIPPKNDNLS